MASFERLGPYVIQKPIGSGGMGSVFLGVDEKTGEQAAVKVLAPALGADPSFRERFETEVETLKKLRHPNIVQLFGYGEQDGQLFYAMEMVEGRTLQQELAAGRRFQWREVARIGVQICQALKHAHDRGVIHRDLKPANLLYTAEEQIKLADFGIAKLYGMTNLTVAGGVIGTADFMSPEQGEGKAVTARSDLYSLGSVLFTLLASRPPFASRNAAEVIHKLRYEDAPPVRRLAPDTPEEFQLIIAQLLQKDPSKRIATALAVANRLKAMDYALSMETRISAESDEFDLAHDHDYRLASEDDSLLNEPTRETRVLGPGDQLADLSLASLQQHRNPTVAMPPSQFPAAEPQEPVQEPTTHFTTYDEEARERELAAPSPDDNVPLWWKVGPLLAATILIVLAIWYFSRPPTAESLYRKIMAVATNGATSELAKVESEIDQFLERFPDSEQSDVVRELRDELNLYRLQKRFERKVRLQGSAHDLGPVQRLYIRAMRAATTDPARAVEQLRALLDVYANTDLSDEDERCLELAQRQLDELQAKSHELFDAELKMIQQRLDTADAIASEQPEQARLIRQGIVTLYVDAPWARDVVARAKEALADHSNGQK